MNPIHPGVAILAAALISAMSLDAASLPLPVPLRGFVSSQPAATWEEGLVCGNGLIGANALSQPRDERVIFSHHRLFMPMGEPVVPPDQSAHLAEIRKLIDEGKYREACQLQFKFSGQESFIYPDFFVPAFDLTIKTDMRGEVRDYARSVDFQTGEATVHWADDRGVFERRMFVSRADKVAVLLLTGPQPGALDCRLKLEPREPSREFNKDSDIAKHSDEMFKEHFGDIRSRADSGGISYFARCLKAYRGSIQAVEGCARVAATGGTTEAQPEGTLVVKGAAGFIIISNVRRLKRGWLSQVVSKRI